MLQQVSGGRYDGTDWPPAFVPFEVPDNEGEDLLRGGLAYRAAAPAPAPAPSAPEPGPGPAPENVFSGTVTSAGAASAQAGIPDAEGQLPDVPKPNDAKQAWVDFAMAHGATEDEANMATKADLMSKYGGRL
jgi:hypothetical protein